VFLSCGKWAFRPFRVLSRRRAAGLLSQRRLWKHAHGRRYTGWKAVFGESFRRPRRKRFSEANFFFFLPSPDTYVRWKGERARGTNVLGGAKGFGPLQDSRRAPVSFEFFQRTIRDPGAGDGSGPASVRRGAPERPGGGDIRTPFLFGERRGWYRRPPPLIFYFHCFCRGPAGPRTLGRQRRPRGAASRAQGRFFFFIRLRQFPWPLGLGEGRKSFPDSFDLFPGPCRGGRWDPGLFVFVSDVSRFYRLQGDPRNWACGVFWNRRPKRKMEKTFFPSFGGGGGAPTANLPRFPPMLKKTTVWNGSGPVERFYFRSARVGVLR